MSRTVACSRRSDSRAREKNSRLEVYNLTRSPTYRRALLSERLEQATRTAISIAVFCLQNLLCLPMKYSLLEVL